MRRVTYPGKVFAAAQVLAVFVAGAHAQAGLEERTEGTEIVVGTTVGDSVSSHERATLSTTKTGEVGRWLTWLKANLPKHRWQRAYFEWQLLAASVPGLSAPESLVTAAGSLLMVWSSTGFHAELELYADGRAHWLALSSGDRVVSTSGDEKQQTIAADFYTAFGSWADAGSSSS